MLTAISLLRCVFRLCVCRMEMISLQGKTNFFEKKVSEYQMAQKEGAFTTEEDF